MCKNKGCLTEGHFSPVAQVARKLAQEDPSLIALKRMTYHIFEKIVGIQELGRVLSMLNSSVGREERIKDWLISKYEEIRILVCKSKKYMALPQSH